MKKIDADELKNKIDNKENLIIIDVRNPQELSRGVIPGSINLPLDKFEDEIEDIVLDKNAEVYLYCLSGSRSMMAAEIMDNLDYKNVYNLNSGMLAWSIKHFPEVNA